MTGEQWRPIPGFPGYEISRGGHVRSYARTNGMVSRTPHLMRIRTDAVGRDVVRMSSKFGVRERSVDALIALAFPDDDGGAG